MFHVSLLEPYREDPSNPAISQLGPIVVEGEDEWEVEKVVREQFNRRASKKQYFVKWAGWSVSHNTWNDKEYLGNVPGALAQYKIKKKHRMSAAGRERRPGRRG